MSLLIRRSRGASQSGRAWISPTRFWFSGSGVPWGFCFVSIFWPRTAACDFSSPSRYWKHNPRQWKHGVLTTGLQGNPTGSESFKGFPDDSLAAPVWEVLKATALKSHFFHFWGRNPSSWLSQTTSLHIGRIEQIITLLLLPDWPNPRPFGSSE